MSTVRQYSGSSNKSLNEALSLYQSIERDFFNQLQATGILFAEHDIEHKHTRELLSRLKEAGARIRNGGASVVLGNLSKGCIACTGSCASRTFAITNNCHRDCYFCFNPNQRDFAYYCEHDFPWRKQLEDLHQEDPATQAIALSGGEPLLKPQEVLAFFTRARELFPKAHLRMYTSGDLLNEELLAKLRDVSMDEIRFSLKTDDDHALLEKVLNLLEFACKYIPTVMVEMPIIPGTSDLMKDLLRRLDNAGAFGINLLEFTYPMWNWEAFDSRDFKLKNPPFSVVYDYTYAGSLAVEGSEELALELMLWAHNEGLNLGMHYCSLENKHRGQIRKLNEPFANANPNYAFDYNDFFLKTINVYGPDCENALTGLRKLNCKNYLYDPKMQTLSFHPQLLTKLEKLVSASYCVSFNVAVTNNGSTYMRELKVVPVDKDTVIQLEDTTAKVDSALNTGGHITSKTIF